MVVHSPAPFPFLKLLMQPSNCSCQKYHLVEKHKPLKAKSHWLPHIISLTKRHPQHLSTQAVKHLTVWHPCKPDPACMWFCLLAYQDELGSHIGMKTSC